MQILTLRNQYATICGYTDQEVDRYFAEHITDWAIKNNTSYDDLRQEIKSWYNGYSFGNNVPKVYNPFSLMNALHVENFHNFWFQSGTPTFLIDILKKEYRNFDLEKITASQDFLGIFDIDTIPATSLMFQAGYLTIVGYDTDLEEYVLDYPNVEIKRSFQKYLLEVFAHINPEIAARLSGKVSGFHSNESQAHLM